MHVLPPVMQHQSVSKCINLQLKVDLELQTADTFGVLSMLKDISFIKQRSVRSNVISTSGAWVLLKQC